MKGVLITSCLRKVTLKDIKTPSDSHCLQKLFFEELLFFGESSFMAGHSNVLSLTDNNECRERLLHSGAGHGRRACQVKQTQSLTLFGRCLITQRLGISQLTHSISNLDGSQKHLVREEI